jgi:hypothetical protein
MVGQTLSSGRSAGTLANELSSLVPVALRGLSQMQDARTGLFSHKAYVDRGGQLTNQGANPLYTGACVIGLLSGQAGRAEPYLGQATRALDALLQRSAERDPAVLATALWGCALADRAEGRRLVERLAAVAEPRRLSSMQLGLAVAGLAGWLRTGERDAGRATAVARAFARELERRFRPEARVFSSIGGRGWRHPALLRMTSFAAQVYPLLGLSELARATGTAASPEVKSVCDFLVRSQGELGQWWWFYSTRAPKVIEGYPVYSVHQDAMAMMALLPATRVGAGDYLDALGGGLRWVTGHNELGQSLVDGRAGLIHRAIQRRGGDCDGLAGWSRPQRGAAYVAALTGRPRSAPSEFERLTECRSYHLGWLLLAAAMAGGDI